MIETSVGRLIPFYEVTDGRKKNRPAVEYYNSGAVYSVYLQNQTIIATPIGSIPAEFITFYESGAVKRIFPLYGQISGYWTTQQEYELAENVTFEVLGQEVTVKPLCIYFYESGNIKSVTIWDKERLTFKTRYGEVTTDLGISLYEDGRLQSIEPVLGTELYIPFVERIKLKSKIKSSGGKYNGIADVIYPFYAMAFRMHADNCSLKFDEEGYIKSVRTVQLYRNVS